MNMNVNAESPAVSDFVARLQTMGLNAAGAGTVLKSLLANPPGHLLPRASQTEKE